MRWFVMRHPDTGGIGCVAESAVQLHRNIGWLRVSEAVNADIRDQLHTADWADAPDLDAAPAPSPQPEPDADVQPVKSKEK